MPRKEPGVLRKLAYGDIAMTPVSEHEAETHELFGTAAARAYVDHERRLRDVYRSAAAAVPAASSAPT
jgi:hypothetical protein